MSQYLIAAPVKDLFTLPDQFKAIYNGKIYIGAVDTDPLNPTNQISIYVVNEDDSRTQVAQPISINSGGYATHNGSPAKFVCDEPYSIVVLDRNDAEQWRAPDIRSIDLMNVTMDDIPGHENYIRVTNAAEIATGIFRDGDFLELSDRNGARFDVKAPGWPQSINGWDVLDAGGGKVAVYRAGAKIYGEHLDMVGDDSFENYGPLQAALNYGKEVILNAGTFKVSTTVDVPVGAGITGASATLTTIKSYVAGGSLLTINGSAAAGNEYNTLQKLTLLSSFGKLSLTDEVAIQHGPTHSVVFAKYERVVIDGFSKAGVTNTRGWHQEYNLCYFIRCGDNTQNRAYRGGVVFDQNGSGTTGWAGSTFTFKETTFIGCEWGVYNDGAWNVTCDNCVFENLNTPFYKSAQGSVMQLRNCWFEDSVNQPDIQGAVMIFGGRSAKTGGQNPSSGINFDGILGASGRVMYYDADVIEHYSDSSGTPETTVNLGTRELTFDKLISKTNAILQSGTGEQVGIDNTNGDFRPFNTNNAQDLGGPSNQWRTGHFGNGVNSGSFTDAQLNDATNSVNTVGKTRGKFVFNTTQGIPVYAAGSNATSAWLKFSDNTTANTPV